jgi:OmpA-OmpF porin, OOP family
MNSSRTIIWSMVVFLLLLSGVALAQEDAKGCKDHPMFTRMNNFYIDDCQENKFDAVDFKDQEGKNITVEGKFSQIHYEIKKGFTPPSGLEVIRNYENAIKKIGGVKVYQEDKYEI